jgi:hypothetical protein
MRSACLAPSRSAEELEAASSAAVARAAPVSTSSPASLLALQRTAGNAAVVALLGGVETAPARVLSRCAGACTCGGSCGSEDLLEEKGAALLARAVAERRTLQRMAACPARLSPKAPIPTGWKSYFGPSWVFHCGYRGILEKRTPSPGNPMNECFYDETGRLVDDKHPHAECGGSPDEYDASGSWKDKFLHFLIDKGGIVQSGAPAFWESMKFGFWKKWDAVTDWVGDKARWVGGKAKAAANWTVNKAKAAASWTGNKAKAAAKWTVNKGKAAASWTGKKLRSVGSWIGSWF